MKLGIELHPEDQKHVLAAYIYRMTNESVAAHPEATAQMLSGGHKMSLITDKQWLMSTSFKVRTDGRLDRRAKSCEHNDNQFRTVL